MIFVKPVSARFSPGRWGFGRTGWESGQDGGISKIKVNPTHVLDHHCTYTRPLASIPAGNSLFPLSAVAFYNLKVHRGKKVEEVGDTF